MNPGMPRIDDSSTLNNFAPATGGLTLRACTIPGTVASTAHCAVASTFDGMSYLCGDWPTSFRSCTALTLATPVVASTFRPVSVTLNRLPPTSSPYVTLFDGSPITVTTPSATDN